MGGGRHGQGDRGEIQVGGAADHLGVQAPVEVLIIKDFNARGDGETPWVAYPGKGAFGAQDVVAIGNADIKLKGAHAGRQIAPGKAFITLSTTSCVQ